MIEERPNQKKKGKKEEASDEDYEDFLDDVENDPTLRKNMKLYKNEKALKGKDLKHMTKEQLDELLGQIDLCELFDDMKIDDKPNTYENEVEGIDELIKGMEKISIEKDQEYEKAQKLKTN